MLEALGSLVFSGRLSLRGYWFLWSINFVYEKLDFCNAFCQSDLKLLGSLAEPAKVCVTVPQNHAFEATVLDSQPPSLKELQTFSYVAI